jgi:hypothetical protein
MNRSMKTGDRRQETKDRRRNASFCILYSVFCILLLTGCRFYQPSESKQVYSYLNKEKDLSTLGRVALVELDNDSSLPQISTDITEALFLAIQKKQIFGLTVVNQDDSAWRSIGLGSDTIHTLEQLLALHEVLNCNAVMLGTVTQYESYPHMSVGLRLRLLDLRDGQLLWALEQVWDSSDKTTERQIKTYFQDQRRSGLAYLGEKLTVVSSRKFIQFVAFKVAETLQSKR